MKSTTSTEVQGYSTGLKGVQRQPCSGHLSDFSDQRIYPGKLQLSFEWQVGIWLNSIKLPNINALIDNCFSGHQLP